MREIEIKARVRHKEAVLRALGEKGVVLGEPITQHDRVYGVPEVVCGRQTKQPVSGDATSPWLRIRTEIAGDKKMHYFTLKRSRAAHLDKIEHEVEANDPDGVVNIIKELGFIEYSDITKTRRKGKIGDIEVCFDDVKDLGDFIELEKLTTEETSYEVVASELWETLQNLGIHRTDEVTKGYDVLMTEQLSDRMA